MLCSSCGKQRNELKRKMSQLWPGHEMWMCNSCDAAGFEPRYVVILVGQDKDIDAVADYLKPKRYIGPEIPATVFVKT